jgi:hypothetical protein
MHVPLQLPRNAVLNRPREVTDVGHGPFSDLSIVAIAFADQGGDDTVPVFDPFDVHLVSLSIDGQQRLIVCGRKNHPDDLTTPRSSPSASCALETGISRPNQTFRQTELRARR